MVPVKGGATFAVLLLVSACGSDPDYYGATRPQHGPDEIWTNLGTEPEYIDPGKCSDSAGGEVITNLFAGLVEPHPKTLKPMPAMATSWTVHESGRRYVFRIRKSAWSDGTPLTARDFEYSWKRLLDPRTASKYGGFLHPIELGEAFNASAILLSSLPNEATEQQLRDLLGAHSEQVIRIQWVPRLSAAALFLTDNGDREAAGVALIKHLEGATLAGSRLHARVTDASAVGVRALDDETLEVRLENPLPYFLDLLGFYVTAPVPRHVIERLEREGKNPDLWTRPEHLVCNGAYVIREWKFRQFIRLERNPHYWDAENVRTSRIQFVMVDSYNTTLNLYKSGDLDYIGGNSRLPQEFLDHLSRFRDFHSHPYLSVYLFWLNVKAKPLDNVKVRKALGLAIDRTSLTKFVTRGGEIPSADLVPDGLAGYRGLRSPTFDPVAAQRLLAEAGFPDGKGFPEITLSYNTSEGHKQIAEAVQQMWKKHLGVHIGIENQEWKVYLKNLQQHSFQMARLGWVGDYADPYTFLELIKTGAGNNHSGWGDLRYDALLRDANATQDRDRRMALLRQAEALAMDQVPLIPLYVYTRAEMWKPYLMGQWPNYQNHHPAKYWWIDRRWYEGRPSAPAPNEPPVSP